MGKEIIMKKVLNLFVIIFLALSLLCLLSCGKKKVEVEKPVEPVETPAPEPVEEQVIEPIKEEPIVIEEKDYQLQLVASTDIYIVEYTQEIVNKYGYKTNITQRYKDGEIYQRLRIDGYRTYSAAIDMGETLKNDLHLIANYWVEKVK